MILSPQQEAALNKVIAWAKNKNGKQVFRLFGYAGTGKTTIAKILAEAVGGNAIFAAYTGKAALALQKSGCSPAGTIHSTIYKPEDSPNGPVFILNPDSAITGASLVVIDEASMVDEEVGKDLLSFGKKVLVLGDPAQIPPVKGAGFFTEGDPDIMLTEIHRQAKDNPIIRLSMDIREGRNILNEDYGQEVLFLRRDDLMRSDVTGADQVLVGMNATRRTFNQKIRAIKGMPENPTFNDRLICLRNNSDRGLMNGSMWQVNKAIVGESPFIPEGILTAHVEPLDMPGASIEVKVPMSFFNGTENDLDRKTRRMHDEFDFGYAITVHKAQGSQWGSVMLMDESKVFRENQTKWLYTGVTRAAEKITIVTN